MEHTTLAPFDIRKILRRLEATDLSPSPLVNELFSALVASVLNGEAGTLDDSSVASRSRYLCSVGESRMEHYWSDKCTLDETAILDFPYLQNYADMVREECDAIAKINPSYLTDARWAFIGSGPLPLSTAFFHDALPTVSFTNVDNDPEALVVGRRCLEQLVPEGRVNHVVADATRFDASSYDVIMLAALVGDDAAAKATIIHDVRQTMRPGSLLVCRSVPAGPRELLYPRTGLHHAGFISHGETASHPSVINNIVLLERTDG